MVTYYVAPNGDNSNSGTSVSSPYADFSPIESDGLNAGDVVKVRGGTYTLSDPVDLKGTIATSNSRAVIEAYEDENPVLDFTPNTGVGVDLTNSEYVTFRGFEVKNADIHNVRANTSMNVVIEGCEIHGHGSGGRFGAGIACALEADRFTVRGCEIYDGRSGGNSDGIRAADGLKNTLIEDTVCHHNSDDGIDLKGSTDGGSYPDQPATLRRVICHNNGQNLDGSISGDGNGFKMGDLNKSTGGHRLERCVAYGNNSRGIGNPGLDVGVEVVNCTATGNGSQNLYLTGGGNHRIDNTLSGDSDGWDVNIDSNADVTTCNWNPSKSGNFNTDSVSFRSTDPSSSDFLKLPSDSQYVDAGTDVGLAYSGSAPDLGAYEVTGSGTTGPILRYYDGTSWVQPTGIGSYDGTSFVGYPVKMWDGATWTTVIDGAPTT